MRTPIFAAIVVAASAIAFPATAQQNPELPKAAPSDQTKEQMHQDVDKGLKTTGQANEQIQRDADKGIKTRNSGESGYVGEQDKPGASAHPPGTGK
jgi:Spy/CpxP family protein refolding chaperone